MSRSLIAATVLTLAAATPAFAHALLKNADPAVGSTAATAPHQVTLDFSEDVEPSFSKIVVQDAAGAEIDARDVHLVPGQGARLAISLKPLPAGTYKVIWHVTSTDTHKTQGSFRFTVGP